MAQLPAYPSKNDGGRRVKMEHEIEKEQIKKVGDRICLGFYEKGILGNKYTALQEAAKRIGFPSFQKNYSSKGFKTEVKALATEGKVHNDGKQGWKVVALSKHGIRYTIQKIVEWRNGLFN